MADPPTRLSIIIVTYNSNAHIHQCLDALAASTSLVGDIVVVDNASADGTASSIRTRWPQVRLIEAGANLGFARATNMGIRATAGELILLLNPDTVPSVGAIEALMTALAARLDAAVAGPRLVDGTGYAELSFGSMMAPLTELRQKILVRGNDRKHGPIAAYVQRLTRRAQDVGWVSGACLLVRRADAEAVELMDERFFMYAEDVDFCAALRSRGRRVIFVPAAEVVHHRGQSRASAESSTAVAYRRSQIAFYEKHHPSWARLLRLYLKLRKRLPDSSITS